MNAEEFLEWIKKKAEKINDICIKNSIHETMGFAIPIPVDVSEEDIKIVDDQLLSLCWCFERLRIKNQEHYVLYPNPI